MLEGESIGNLGGIFADLEKQGAAEFAAEGLHGLAQWTVDLRYRHQGYELNVRYDPEAPERSLEAFHELHRQRYGFADAARPLEIVNLRLRMIAASEPYEPQRQKMVPGDGSAAYDATREVYFEGGFRPVRFYRREKLMPGESIVGPAMVTEYTAATLLPPGCTARVDELANLVIKVAEEAAA
jgi:N-methylhydantoinase A